MCDKNFNLFESYRDLGIIYLIFKQISMALPPPKNSKLAALQPDKVKAVQSILSKKAARGKKADPFNTVSRP